MVQIVPAILAKSEAEMIAKIERVRPLGLMVQIDVMDNVFVANETWSAPSETAKLLRGLPFEAHLMVMNPEHATMVWLAAGATRVFYHAETTRRDDLIIRSAGHDSGKVGIAINPDTPISRIAPILSAVHSVLVMGVPPGWSGQSMMPITFEKIRAIKTLNPTVTVAVDGGVTLENAARLVQAGADILVAASAITDAADPRQALSDLKRVAEAAQ